MPPSKIARTLGVTAYFSMVAGGALVSLSFDGGAPVDRPVRGGTLKKAPSAPVRDEKASC